MTRTTPTIELVDAPDKRDDPIDIGRTGEGQRTYKITDEKARHTVRIRRADDSNWQYVVENLVQGRWHKLLTGENVDMQIPFDVAVARAVAVLS
jgi:hypothetical protein